jgi:hypothetical protein
MLNNNKTNKRIYNAILERLIADGMDEDKARLEMASKMAEIELISPPDTYTPQNVDDTELGDWSKLRAMLAAGEWLQERTVSMMTKGRGRYSVKGVIKALRMRHNRMDHVSDEFAYEAVRYAITNVGLFRNKKINKGNLGKRSKAMVWFNKSSKIEVDYDKGEIYVPSFNKGEVFTIKIDEPIKRNKLRNIRLTRNDVTTNGMLVHIHHHDDVIDERAHVDSIVAGLTEVRLEGKGNKEEETKSKPKNDLNDLFGNGN